jgi:chitinase
VSPRRTVTLLLVLGLGLLVSGCTAPQPSTTTESTAPVAAPYVDVTGPRADLAAAAGATGTREFVLAFVLATNGRCEPSWGGVTPLDDAGLKAEMTGLRDRGVALTVASGGAQGQYLEQVCGSATELAAAYGQALDSVGATRLDLDIEADVDAARVVAAVRELQSTRDVPVTLTLRVADQNTGLEPAAVDLVRAATDAGVDVTVNAMVMNFPPDGPWGAAMVQAAESSARQLGQLGWSEQDRYHRLGLTVMIGRNDMGMVTTPDDAEAVRAFAEERGIGRLSYWSLARDNGGCPDLAQASPSCSGVAQSPYEFTNIFNGSGRSTG